MGQELGFQVPQVAGGPGLAPELVKYTPVPYAGPGAVFGPVGLGGKVLQPVPVHAQVVQLARLERRAAGDLPGAGAVVVQNVRQAVAALALKHAVQHAGVVAKQHRFVVVDAFIAEQPDVEQLVPAQRPVKAAGLESFQQQLLRVADAMFADRHQPPLDRAVLLVDAVAGTGRQPHAGRLHGGVELFVHRGFDQVVAVHKAHVIAAGVVQPGVAGVGGAAVFLVEHADARVGFGQLVAQRAGTVGAAVVDEQQLKVGKRLRQNAAHRAFEVILGIINAGDDTDFGGIAHGVLLNKTVVTKNAVWPACRRPAGPARGRQGPGGRAGPAGGGGRRAGGRAARRGRRRRPKCGQTARGAGQTA